MLQQMFVQFTQTVESNVQLQAETQYIARGTITRFQSGLKNEDSE